MYVVLDPSQDHSQVPTGSTYGSIQPGTGSQQVVSFLSFDGATGRTRKALTPIQPEVRGHQFFPDLAIEGGALHVLWYDTRNDSCYSPARPIGNCADRTSVPALDVFATSSTDGGRTFAAATRVTTTTTNGNWEQFGGRTVPFAGDYLWVSAVGATSYGTWTDYRDTVAATDPREVAEDEGSSSTDVKQCRTLLSSGSFRGDTCPRTGGLDQNVYGARTP